MKNMFNLIFLTSFFILNHLPAQQAVVDEEGVYLMCEKMPELIGGMDALPPKSLGVQGVVYLQCVINEKGEITSPKIVKKLGAGCDEEAVRVLKKSKFKPGYDKGKPVRVRFTIPVFFRL